MICYDCFKVEGWDGHFLLRMVAMLGIEEQFAFDIFTERPRQSESCH